MIDGGGLLSFGTGSVLHVTNSVFTNLPNGAFLGGALIGTAYGSVFHLQATNPAVDAADPTVIGTPDFDGLTRPQGLHSDMGAFEFKPSLRGSRNGSRITGM